MAAPFAFRAAVIEWRGPAPYFYAPIPAEHVDAIRRASRVVSYGWGVIPVEATVSGISFTTSLFPKDDTYLLPLKLDVRRRTGITVGDTIDVTMALQPR